jgi:hypothetical protein
VIVLAQARFRVLPTDFGDADTRAGNSGAKNRPVWLCACAAIVSGVPSATT